MCRQALTGTKFFNLTRTILLVVVLLCGGCGGGTTGTGGTGSLDFSGRVLSDSGSPIGNVTVTIQETGDTAITDNEGKFKIESNVTSAELTLLVETDSAQAMTTISGLPQTPAEVDVVLQLSVENNTVAVQSQQVRPKPQRPAATPTAAPQPTPQPSPARTPTAAPATPTAVATPTSTPSTTPSVQPTATPAQTLIRGTLVAPSTLLAVAQIGIVGQNKAAVAADGSFSFRTTVATANPLLEVSAGNRTDQVILSGVTPGTTRVILQLSVSQVSPPTFELNLDSAQIIP